MVSSNIVIFFYSYKFDKIIIYKIMKAFFWHKEKKTSKISLSISIGGSFAYDVYLKPYWQKMGKGGAQTDLILEKNGAFGNQVKGKLLVGRHH